jgi:hypothetical protein
VHRVAECPTGGTWQFFLKKLFSLPSALLEALGKARQRIYFLKIFAEWLHQGTRQRKYFFVLPSALAQALGKDFIKKIKKIFAECHK